MLQVELSLKPNPISCRFLPFSHKAGNIGYYLTVGSRRRTPTSKRVATRTCVLVHSELSIPYTSIQAWQLLFHTWSTPPASQLASQSATCVENRSTRVLLLETKSHISYMSCHIISHRIRTLRQSFMEIVIPVMLLSDPNHWALGVNF